MRSVKEIEDAIMATKSTIAFCDERLALKVTHLNPKLVNDLVDKRNMSFTIVQCLEWSLGVYPQLPVPAF
jgi:hypothetical protein